MVVVVVGWFSWRRAKEGPTTVRVLSDFSGIEDYENDREEKRGTRKWENTK